MAPILRRVEPAPRPPSQSHGGWEGDALDNVWGERRAAEWPLYGGSGQAAVSWGERRTAEPPLRGGSAQAAIAWEELCIAESSARAGSDQDAVA